VKPEPTEPSGTISSPSGSFRLNIRYEALSFTRFGFVGLLATIIHLSVATALISLFGTPAVLANAIAFTVAFLVAFSGHYAWAFRSQANRWHAILRYLTVSLSGFVVNNALLLYLINKTWIEPRISVALAALIIPIITFIPSRLWAFK